MLLQAGKIMFDTSGFLLKRISLATVLEKRGVQKSGFIFVDQIFQDQEHLIQNCRKSSKDGRRSVQIGKKLLTELISKESMQEVEKI